MKRMLRLIGLGLAVSMALMMNGCLYKTGSTEVGVRTIKWSLLGKKGVVEQYFEPGKTHVFLPFVNDWHTFDTRLQVLEMTQDRGSGDRASADDLRFKTIDGNDIGLDVTITFRINPEMAPVILQKVALNDKELRENIVRTISRSKPRDIFGELVTEQFYVATQRELKSKEAKERLNEILEPYGVVVENVLTSSYRFNPKYEKAIEDKKVADQEAERLKSETRAREQEFSMKVEEEKATVETVRTNADRDYERAKIEADAYYAQQVLIAKATLAEGQAEAEGIEKMNEALAGSGGEAMVKMAIAEALQSKRIIMLPMGGGGLDVRSTDVNQLLEVYGIKSMTQAPPAPMNTQPGGSARPQTR